MSKIPEVLIKSFHTVLKSELPDSAVLGRPIISTDTMELYIGAGEGLPLMRMQELVIVNTVSDLIPDIASTLKIYITKDSNRKYFYDGTQYIMIEGLGVFYVLDNYSSLPISNNVNGLFAIKTDETNNNLAGIYFYNKSTASYKRVSFVESVNTYSGIKVNSTDLYAANYNDSLKLKSGNTINLIVDKATKTINVNQKANANIEMEIKTFNTTSGLKASLPAAIDRAYIASCLGKIYLFGGYSSAFNNVVYCYDEATDTWTDTGYVLPYIGGYGRAVTYNDKIYLVGGYYTVGTAYYTLDYLYEFDPITGTFIQKASMNTKRMGFAAALINDKIWITGGLYYTTTSSSSYVDAKTVEYYDFSTDTWTQLAATYNMPVSTYYNAHFVIGNELHCVGGYNKSSSAYKNLHQVFNVDTLTWSNKAAYPYSYANSVGVSINGLGYVAGGYPDGTSNSYACYVYLPKTDSWVFRYNMNSRRSATQGVVHNGSIYMIGGGYYWNYYSSSSYTRVAIVETYHPIYEIATKDCEILLRNPQVLTGTTIDSNLLNTSNADLSRNITLEAGDYWEYGDWRTSGTVEVLIKSFNY